MTETRPWGSFTILDEGASYKVKRLVVNPGMRFSLQYHNKRAEHWTVVSGIGRAVCGDEVIAIAPDDHIYIGIGVMHRLESTSREPLVIIEVQYGDYLEEDDIVRLEDDFQRG